MSVKAVVFDLGGVLVDWQPRLAWIDDFGDDQALEAFLDRVGFSTKNARADNGEAFTSLATEIEDEADRARFLEYIPRYARTVQNLIPGTWDILERLRDKGFEIHAITNWSAETWPEGLKAQPRLGQAFGVTIVSGQEGVMKPDTKIFNILLERTGLKAEECIFIDDGAMNVAGARIAGMDAIHFKSPRLLELDLAERGVL